jgi:hypothetical protein
MSTRSQPTSACRREWRVGVRDVTPDQGFAVLRRSLSDGANEAARLTGKRLPRRRGSQLLRSASLERRAPAGDKALISGDNPAQVARVVLVPADTGREPRSTRPVCTAHATYGVCVGRG